MVATVLNRANSSGGVGSPNSNSSNKRRVEWFRGNKRNPLRYRRHESPDGKKERMDRSDRTPPVSPDDELDRGHSPMRHVHVWKRPGWHQGGRDGGGGGGGQGDASNNHNESHYPPNSSGLAADTNTVVSELTYPNEMPSYTHATLDPVRENVLRKSSPATSTMSTSTSSQPHPVVDETGDDSPNLLNSLLGMVEVSCLTPMQQTLGRNADTCCKTIHKKHSFAPEWGQAPTYEDEDEEVELQRYQSQRLDQYTYDQDTDDGEEEIDEDGEGLATPLRHNVNQEPATGLPGNGDGHTPHTGKFLAAVRHQTGVPEQDYFELVLHEQPLVQSTDGSLWGTLTQEPQKQVIITVGTNDMHPVTIMPTTQSKQGSEQSRGPVDGSKKTKSSRKPFRAVFANPAAILLKKARAARERKKAEEKEQRYKKILLSLKEKNEKAMQHTNTTDLKILPEVSDEESSTQIALVAKKKNEVEEPPTKPLPVETTNPNAEEINTSKEEDGESIQSASATFMRTYSEPGPVDEKVKDSPKEPTKKPIENCVKTYLATGEEKKDIGRSISPTTGGQWKEATCPQSGRKYYYHRLTRQSTWQKPPESAMYKREASGLKSEATNTDQDKQDEIARILSSMVSHKNDPKTPKIGGEHVDGEEDELLDHIKALVESKPFDEPLQDAPPIVKSRTSTTRNTTTSVVSEVSGLVSEQTPQIRNTRRINRSVHAIREDDDSASLDGDAVRGSIPDEAPSNPPSDIPIPRRRELKVEEFTMDRRFELYDTRRQIVTDVSATPTTTLVDRIKSSSGSDFTHPHGKTRKVDPQDYSTELDSVSALSDPETSGRRRHKIDVYESRKRALNDAIINEDWDLAAILSDGLRSLKAPKEQRKRDQKPWIQSELDRFISENDWDAVKKYIASVRSEQPKGQGLAKSRSEGSYFTSGSLVDSPRKRFGARSQLQHCGLNTDISWESNSTSYDSYSDGTYSEEERLRRKGNFVC